jgi:hypothetical protein
VLHNSWTRKSDQLACFLYTASTLHRSFSLWRSKRNWDVVIQRRVGLPIMFWATWRKRIAFNALLSYTRSEREVKDMQASVDAYRDGMLRRAGVRGIVVAADAKWEERVKKIKGMDERSARLGLKFGMRWMNQAFNGRKLTCKCFYLSK